MKIYYYMYK